MQEVMDNDPADPEPKELYTAVSLHVSFTHQWRQKLSLSTGSSHTLRHVTGGDGNSIHNLMIAR